jgi:hypothetical protein
MAHDALDARADSPSEKGAACLPSWRRAKIVAVEGEFQAAFGMLARADNRATRFMEGGK